MLKILIGQNRLVFVDMDYEMMNTLQDKFKFNFILDGDEYRIDGEPGYLYKVLYKIAGDYEIELN